MQAAISALHHSPLVRVLDFKCQCGRDPRRASEQTQKFTISFTRRGSFGYHIGRRNYEVHSGIVLLEKAGCEYAISHPSTINDECTIFELGEDVLHDLQPEAGRGEQYFFMANVAPVAFLPTNSSLEYLHAALVQAAQAPFACSRFNFEELFLALLRQINLQTQVSGRAPAFGKLKEHQREAMDLAKHFILANFQRDLSLAEIARHSHVSVFHFSRLFKQFTSHSPYQFLRAVRLQRAALLLTHTALPVTQICFEAGFNSFEHFILSFTKQFGLSPSKYRKR